MAYKCHGGRRSEPKVLEATIHMTAEAPERVHLHADEDIYIECSLEEKIPGQVLLYVDDTVLMYYRLCQPCSSVSVICVCFASLIHTRTPKSSSSVTPRGFHRQTLPNPSHKKSRSMNITTFHHCGPRHAWLEVFSRS
jgi:hypothetical protein